MPIHAVHCELQRHVNGPQFVGLTLLASDIEWNSGTVCEHYLLACIMSALRGPPVLCSAMQCCAFFVIFEVDKAINWWSLSCQNCQSGQRTENSEIVSSLNTDTVGTAGRAATEGLPNYPPIYRIIRFFQITWFRQRVAAIEDCFVEFNKINAIRALNYTRLKSIVMYSTLLGIS